MEAKYNVWLEQDGVVVMSLIRAEFLRAIERTHSLKAAAGHMGFSYHEAQLKLDEMETGLGYKVVTYVPCEEGQEDVRLTPEGERLLRSFEKFAGNFEQEIADRFDGAFQ